MRSTGSLYAFDVNEKRLAGLTPRMRRAGLSNVHPIAIRGEDDQRVRRLNGKFDRVLIDAPCTGTGTFRRNPDLKWRLSPSELERINAIQKSVLEHASRLVKAGGRLVYATCSVLKRENQDVVEAFLAAHSEWRLVPAKEVFAQQGIVFPEAQWERFGSYFQMLPHVNNTDGFFAAVLERSAPAKRENSHFVAVLHGIVVFGHFLIHGTAHALEVAEGARPRFASGDERRAHVAQSRRVGLKFHDFVSSPHGVAKAGKVKNLDFHSRTTKN